MKTLGIFSGGGAPGLYLHAGMMEAVHARYEFDETIGASAGAFAAAWIASGRDPRDFSNIILSLYDHDFRDERFMWKLRMAWKGVDSIFRDEKIRRIIARMFPETFGALTKPCGIMAVRFDTVCDVEISSGNLRDAVLASMSIPGIFPAVEIDGVRMVDGGIRKNVPIPSVERLREFDRIMIFIAGGNFYVRDHGILQNSISAMQALMRGQAFNALERVGVSEQDVLGNDGYFRAEWDGREVQVFWPQIWIQHGAFRTDHSLYALAKHWAIKKITTGGSKE